MSEMSDSCNAVAGALGVTVRDGRLWRQALTHPSYANENPREGPSYERLEFLGDALIGAAVAAILIRERQQATEGELTLLRSALVRRETLAAWAERLPLDGALKLGRGTGGLTGPGRASILANVAEALLAAVYLDHGWDVFLATVHRELASVIPDVRDARAAFEPKGTLQERLSRSGKAFPVYEVVARSEEGGVAKVRVVWDGGSAVGCGRNRREAELDAARRALDTLDRVDQARDRE